MTKRNRTRRIRPPTSAELAEFKAFLGPFAQDFADGELRQLRREMNAMAELLLDLYLNKDKKQEPPTIEF